jgi:hypothetical protein
VFIFDLFIVHEVLKVFALTSKLSDCECKDVGKEGQAANSCLKKSFSLFRKLLNSIFAKSFNTQNVD